MVLGVLLVLVLAALYGLAARAIVQVPFRALGILVGGMAFHNVVIMVLLRLGTPHLLVRIAQAWKEGILLLLVVLAARLGWHAWQAGHRPRLLFLDWLMAAFTILVLVYVLIPSQIFGVPVTLGQKLVAIRVDLLLPLLYFFGRVFWTNRRADLLWSIGAIAGSAAVVGLVGLIELWLIPTRWWLDFGVNQLSAWLGFTYHGPKGLPENFFQPGAEGLLLRREVSTYVSPLGVAYSGLLVVPVAIVFAQALRRVSRQRWLSLALLMLALVGILFSITRLAIGLTALEVICLALLFRWRWLIATAVALPLAALLIIYGYPQVGPLVSTDLTAVAHHKALHLTSSTDPSLQEHANMLAYDLEYVRLHPLGTGLGSAIHRFGSSQGTGESALFNFVGELGILGGATYVPLYFLMTIAGLRALLRTRRDALLSGLPLVASFGGLTLFLITLTSDVWGNLAVTFLFWWAAGYSVATIARPVTDLRARDLPASTGLAAPDRF